MSSEATPFEQSEELPSPGWPDLAAQAHVITDRYGSDDEYGAEAIASWTDSTFNGYTLRRSQDAFELAAYDTEPDPYMLVYFKDIGVDDETLVVPPVLRQEMPREMSDEEAARKILGNIFAEAPGSEMHRQLTLEVWDTAMTMHAWQRGQTLGDIATSHLISTTPELSAVEPVVPKPPYCPN
jgi:hypothetical protein